MYSLFLQHLPKGIKQFEGVNKNNGAADAVIWNVVAENELTMLGLEATPLTDDPRFLQATEAVVLTRVDDYPMQQLLRAVVDKQALLAHQQRVVSGEQEPSY